MTRNSDHSPKQHHLTGSTTMGTFRIMSLEEELMRAVYNEAGLIRQNVIQTAQARNSMQGAVLIMRANDEEIYYLREHLLENNPTRVMFQETMIDTVTNDIHLIRDHLLQAAPAREKLMP